MRGSEDRRQTHAASAEDVVDTARQGKGGEGEEEVEGPQMVPELKYLSAVDAVLQAAAEYHLTDREQEALIGITMGLTCKEVAERMDISPNTVRAFLRLIMIKMGVPTRAGIVGRLHDQRSGALQIRTEGG
jgi:DNA-binding CsgD family transcriptional regulator